MAPAAVGTEKKSWPKKKDRIVTVAAAPPWAYPTPLGTTNPAVLLYCCRHRSVTCMAQHRDKAAVSLARQGGPTFEIYALLSRFDYHEVPEHRCICTCSRLGLNGQACFCDNRGCEAWFGLTWLGCCCALKEWLTRLQEVLVPRLSKVTLVITAPCSRKR